MKRGCSDNEGYGGDPPDERQLPRNYLTKNGKGRAPDPPRVPTPPPEEEEQGPEEIFGTCVAACQAQSHAHLSLIQDDALHSAGDAGWVNRHEYLSNPDVFVSVFSLLHLRWLMMMLCTCKFFSSSYASDHILEITKKRLFLTFPKLSFIHPDKKFVDLRRMYVDYFMDASSESLFSDHGSWLLKFWFLSEPRIPPGGSYIASNLFFNLGFLRRAGYFSTLYSRWRLYFKIGRKFDEFVQHLMNASRPSHLAQHAYRNPMICWRLRMLMNYEFVRTLCLDSFGVSSSPMFSGSWLKFPMHPPFLVSILIKCHMDIFEPDVKRLNDNFVRFSRDPSMEGLRSVFPRLRDQEVMNRILEHMRFASTLPNNFSVIPDVFFPHPEGGVFHPFAWALTPKEVPLILENFNQFRMPRFVTVLSTVAADRWWRLVVDMSRRSRVYGDDRELITLTTLREIANALEVAEPPSEND